MAIIGSDEKGRPIFRDIIDPNGFQVRQNLIKQIESEIDGALVTYTANLGHPGSGIMIQDAILLMLRPGFGYPLREFNTTIYAPKFYR